MADEHTRTLIRQAIKARMIQTREVEGETLYPTPAGTKVFLAREVPVTKPKLPAVCIYDDEETTDGEYFQDMPKRVVALGVEYWAEDEDSEALDLKLDQGALAVERVVLADLKQGGNANNTTYTGTEKQRFTKGKTFFGAVMVSFDIEYLQPDEDNTGDLDDLLRFRVRHDLAPADANIDAEDLVTVPGPEE